ncbi:hypothetical protein JM83_1520 [Gillisia sp. Hel_I_86]|nr:hypothetical protein JM83_1520 [Gillisia sp. Hel_I_86]
MEDNSFWKTIKNYIHFKIFIGVIALIIFIILLIIKIITG